MVNVSSRSISTALLIDESYNANPASMAATLKSLGQERDVTRRIAVLGPMRELGEQGPQLHAALAPELVGAAVDCAILIGDEMQPLVEALDDGLAVTAAANVDDAAAMLLGDLRPGDAVLVKASNSVGLAKLVDRVAKELACST